MSSETLAGIPIGASFGGQLTNIFLIILKFRCFVHQLKLNQKFYESILGPPLYGLCYLYKGMVGDGTVVEIFLREEIGKGRVITLSSSLQTSSTCFFLLLLFSTAAAVSDIF